MNHSKHRRHPRREWNISVEPLESRFLLSRGLQPPLPMPSTMPVGEIASASLARPTRAMSSLVLPRPSGSYRVGETSIEVVDPSRPDPFSGDANTQRDLMVTLWYPAGQVGPRTPLAPYVPDAKLYATYVAADLNAGSDSKVTVDEVRQMLASTQTHAWLGAPLSPRQRVYPVVLLLPGRGSPPEFYTAYAEDLASRGYVVAGVNPSRISDVTVFPDGRIITSRVPDIETIPIEQVGAESARETEILAADARTVLDQLARMNQGSPLSFLRGRLDLSHVAVVGHSLGGAAAAQLVATDSRFRTGIDLDGTLWGPVQSAGVGKPFLFLVASDPTAQQLKQSGLSRQAYQQMVDRSALDTAGIAATIRAGGSRIILNGFHHSSFTDQELLQPISPDGPSDAQGIRVVETYMAEFLRTTLFDRRSDLFGPHARTYRGVWFSTPTA